MEDVLVEAFLRYPSVWSDICIVRSHPHPETVTELAIIASRSDMAGDLPFPSSGQSQHIWLAFPELVTPPDDHLHFLVEETLKQPRTLRVMRLLCANLENETGRPVHCIRQVVMAFTTAPLPSEPKLKRRFLSLAYRWSAIPHIVDVEMGEWLSETVPFMAEEDFYFLFPFWRVHLKT